MKLKWNRSLLIVAFLFCAGCDFLDPGMDPRGKEHLEQQIAQFKEEAARNPPGDCTVAAVISTTFRVYKKSARKKSKIRRILDGVGFSAEDHNWYLQWMEDRRAVGCGTGHERDSI